MRHDLAESLFAAFVFRVDPILAAGAWPSGEELTDEDIAWITSLGHILRLELVEPLPRATATDGDFVLEHDAAGRAIVRAIAPASESELRAMHGDR